MAGCYRFEEFEIDLGSFRLFKGRRAISIEPKALNLLIFLVENRGRLVRKRELIAAVWGDAFVTEHVLSRAIGQLRKLLEDDAKEPKYIETVPTLGFRFIAEVESAPAESTESPSTNSLKARSIQEAVVSRQQLAVMDELEVGATEVALFRSTGFLPPALSSSPHLDSIQPRAASVGVLPFVNLSADPDNEFFADGITQDVIAHLAKIKAIKVISRTSMMAFKKSDCSLREIGEKLGAATLLEGSVRRENNRVRIVAQLVDVATDEHIWAEIYDRNLTDIFAIQSDVALNIANALRAELSKDERTRLGRRPTYDIEAYDLYLRGRDWFYRFNEEGYRQSVIAFRSAIDRDSRFALAWAGMAESYGELCIGGYVVDSGEKIIRSAKMAAARALEIDPELAQAHGISAFIRFVFDFDWAGAEREFLKTIELSPGSAEVHCHYGWLCSAVGRFDDAVREVKRARELDPLLIQSDVATALLRAGRKEEALEEARRSVLALPQNPRCHSGLAWALILNGDVVGGIAELERTVALSPDNTQLLAQLGQASALTGNVARAREILDALRDRSTREHISPYHFAYVHAGLGEVDEATAWLERALEQRSGAIYGIKGSFLFRNLHGHPRFETLLRKMNLV